MNAFTDMRIRYFETACKESFAEYYLAHRCYVSDQDDAARYQLRSKIASIRALYENESVSEADMLRLLAEIGENLYLDRYMVELMLLYRDQLSGKPVQDALAEMLSDAKISAQRLALLLDLCIECSLPLLGEERLLELLSTFRRDLDVFSLLLEYALHLSAPVSADMLFGYLGEDLPETIHMQIIDLLIALDPDETALTAQLRQKQIPEQRLNLYLSYLNFRREQMIADSCGIVVVQPMFYGDPEYSGKGQSGGLGTLLKTLGNQLSKQRQISQVITLTIHQDWSEPKSFLRQYEPGHWLVRLPVYLNAEDPHAFFRREWSIKRAVARFFRQWQIEPDLFHVRYLDNASKAMASLSKEIHAKLVFTLTPDPHRSMVDATGDILCFKVEETLEKLNQITIGDALLAMTDGIVGIGGDFVKSELELYFPQLQQTHDSSRFRMIGEGIRTDIDTQFFDVWQFIEDHTLAFSIDPDKRDKPVLFNVGRLKRQKGQHHLLRAWGDSLLWQDFNLILIGGSRESTDEEEREMTAFIDAYMASNPHLIGRFSHVAALPNEEVRRIERRIMERPALTYPNIYVSSSAKEEFGISILEALSEGFLAFVPIKGGAKTYIADGINGFLIDTTDNTTLMKDMERVIYQSQMSLADFKKIQRAGKRTVLDQFSIEEIAKRFLELYLGLSDSGELLCVANGSSF